MSLGSSGSFHDHSSEQTTTSISSTSGSTNIIALL